MLSAYFFNDFRDRAAQGRACGNLGNVHYLLGNFAKAIHFHKERLEIAREFGDRAAERRAHSNLGNAHIFLGEFERAAEHYKRTLLLAQDLGDRAVEAQACYSLGNTYTLLKDYPNAIEYHLRHLSIAQELFDKVGEGRACWSLGNAHSSMGQHEEAYHYARRHLQISHDTNDRMGQATAQLNMSELTKTLGYTPEETTKLPHMKAKSNETASPITVDEAMKKSRRISMEHMDLIKMTPDAKKAAAAAAAAKGKNKANSSLNKSGLLDEEDFFDFITRFQSKRMDDQRCSLTVPTTSTTANTRKAAGAPALGHALDGQQNNQNAVNTGAISKNPAAASSTGTNKEGHDLMDLIAGVQGHRMNEQRATVPFLPGLTKAKQPEILQR